MKVTSKLKCPGCDISTEAVFKKPGILGDVTKIEVICDGCGSTLAFHISRLSTRSDKINIKAGIKIMSDLLQNMMKEEAEHRMKPVEDQ